MPESVVNEDDGAVVGEDQVGTTVAVIRVDETVVRFGLHGLDAVVQLFAPDDAEVLVEQGALSRSTAGANTASIEMEFAVTAVPAAGPGNDRHAKLAARLRSADDPACP